MTTNRTIQGSELVVHAARLVRLVRQSLDHPAGTRALALLDQHGPLTITAMAQADNCSQPTMSGTVAALVERGWVTKQANPADARSSVVALTPDGRSALSEVRLTHGALVAERLSGHTPEEIATAIRVLRTISRPGSEPGPQGTP